MERRSQRVSASQWDIAMDFLERNPTIIRGYNNSARGRQLSQRLWQELTELLNAEGSGATKSYKDWTTYFNNYKSKLKKMVSDLHTEATATGGGPPMADSLSDLDRRFLAIMGPGFGQGTPNVRVNPFPNVGAEQPTPASAELEMQQEIEIIDIPLVDPSEHGIVITTGRESPQPSTSGIQQASVRSPPPNRDAPAQPLPRQTRRTRYHTRPMAPIDEARRILSQVEMQRAAADAEQARALHLIAENLGRLANAFERYFSMNTQ